MKIFTWGIILLLFSVCLSAQDIDAIINAKEVERVEKVLSSDDMKGRATFSPGIEKAADFIESEFKSAGLQTWNNNKSYRQPFAVVKSKRISAGGNLDGVVLPEASIVAVTSEASLAIDEHSGYEVVTIKAGEQLGARAMKYIGQDSKNYLVLVDTNFAKNFGRLSYFAGQSFKSPRSVIFVLSSVTPTRYSIKTTQEITEQKLANVIGILPGKSKKDEYVIFSGHYDHLGVGKPDPKGDTIFNGANDDASGSTAVIMLAKYFSKAHDNERTLVFVTFTAEEIGGYGSQFFSRQFEPEKVKAMFNIEMIGTESKWGVNSAYITGYDRSDMGKILEKNLQGSQFAFHPDPYPDQQLFYRSDNATLARQGVPAHTISTSKMDSEKFYHTQGDEIGTLDMNNMARIIKSIAISSKTIVAGADTPSRVDTSQLR